MKLKRIFILLTIITIAFIIGNTQEVEASSSFAIRLNSVDAANTNTRTTNSRYSMPTLDGPVQFNLGTTGTDVYRNAFYTGDYTITQTQASTGYTRQASNINLRVTRDAQGRYSATVSGNPNASVTVNNNLNPPEVIVTIRDVRNTFAIRLNSVDSANTNTRTANSIYSMSTLDGPVQFSLGSTGTNIYRNAFHTGDYTITQTQASTGYARQTNNIRLNVTRNAQGQYAATVSGNPNASVTVNNSLNPPEVIVTIRDVRNTFAIRLNSVDSANTNTRTANSIYSMSTLDGPVQFSLGSTGTNIYRNAFHTGDYTITQTQASTGYARQTNNIRLNVTRNAQGQYAATVSGNPNASVTVNNNLNPPEVIVTIRDVRNTFAIRLNSVDSANTNTRTANSIYSMSTLDGPVQFNLGSTGTDIYRNAFHSGDYTITQGQASTGYARQTNNIRLNVTRNAQGQYAATVSGNSNASVTVNNSLNPPEVIVTIRDVRNATPTVAPTPTPTPTATPRPTATPAPTSAPVASFALRLSSVDATTGARTTNSQYLVQFQGAGVDTQFDLGSAGTHVRSGFTAMSYTVRQVQVSSGGYSAQEPITLNVTRNTNGTFSVTTNRPGSEVSLSVNNSSNPPEVHLIIRDRRSTTPTPTPTPTSNPNGINISISTIDKGDRSIVTGGIYVVQPSQGNSATYTIGSSGTANNTFNILPAGTYTYAIRQTRTSTNCVPMENIELYVTYNSNGAITRVSTNSRNLAGSFNSHSISLQLLETKTSDTRPIDPVNPIDTVGDFSIAISTPGHSTGTLTLQGPTGTNKSYVMNNGTARHSDFRAPAAGRYTYKILNASYITGNNAEITLFITFDANGKITNVSTDSRHIGGTFAHNNISISISR